MIRAGSGHLAPVEVTSRFGDASRLVTTFCAPAISQNFTKCCSLLLRKVTVQHHQTLRLPPKVTCPTSPNVAVAAKSDTPSSPKLRLPPRVTLQNPQMLRLPQKVTFQNHQMLPLPRTVTLQHQQVLHLLRKVTFQNRHVSRATESDTPTSPNSAPAMKSDTPTSPNDAPTTKSETPTSPNIAPATKSHETNRMRRHLHGGRFENDPTMIRAGSGHLAPAEVTSRFGDAFCIGKNNILGSGYLAKFHKCCSLLLRLRKVTFQHHQTLRLPQK